MNAQQIATAFHPVPSANVIANWPHIVAALAHEGITSPAALIAAAATIRVECPPFAPRSEQYDGDPAAYFARYDGRKDLGNCATGDGLRFRGRGYVQITGRYNYQRYGAELGVDLVGNPDEALAPSTAARIFARFFAARHIAAAAEAGAWTEVRRLVNGGTNGLAEFTGYVGRLKILP